MKMAKKVLCFLFTLCLLSGFSAQPCTAAATLGISRYTDVLTFINNYPIPSFEYRGYTFIVAEDLNNYGFDVIWNSWGNSLCIYPNSDKEITPVPTYAPTADLLGKTRFLVTTTPTRTYIGNYGYEIECLGGFPGYTLINVDNLAPFGSVSWSAWDNAVFVSLNHMPSAPSPEWVGLMPGFSCNTYYPYTSIPDFGSLYGVEPDYGEHATYSSRSGYYFYDYIYSLPSYRDFFTDYVTCLAQNGYIYYDNYEDDVSQMTAFKKGSQIVAFGLTEDTDNSLYVTIIFGQSY